VEWERKERAFKAARSGETHHVPGLGRIVATAEAVQHDWLMTGTALENQGLGSLAADVERFRQSLRVPLTRQERAVVTIRRARVEERPPVPLELGS
jgi:hypothetical protein